MENLCEVSVHFSIIEYEDEDSSETRGEILSSAIATFGGRYVKRAVLKLFMTFYAFLIISVHKTLNFMHFSQKHYIRTDGRTDRRTYPLIEIRGRI